MNKDFLPPKYDIVFKLLFGDERSLDILIQFLKAVLKVPHDEYEKYLSLTQLYFEIFQRIN